MITMARIQSPAMGYAGFQKPIIQMGQDGSFSAGPIGAGVTPPAAPVFLTPNYPNYVPNYNFPVIEQPVPAAPSSAPTPMPTWTIIGLAVAAGAVVTALVMKH